MGQQECLDWLKDQKKTNPNKWFRTKDVVEGMKEKGLGVGTLRKTGVYLFKLAVCNDIDVRGVGFWEHYKEFRAK